MGEAFNASAWLVDRWVDAGHGDRTALRVEGRSVTYAQLLEQVRSAAAGLRAIGTRPEERVFLAMFNTVELVAAILGAMRIGAIPALANVLLPTGDLASVAQDARARVAMISSRVAAAELAAGAPELRTIVVAGEEAPASADRAEVLRWEDAMTAGDGEPYPTVEDSPGFWLCTSGSTGLPKLAMHRHVDLRHSFDTYARHVLGVTSDDRFLSVAPITHAYGLGASITFPFAAGGTSIVDPSFPTPPQRIAELAATEAPTLLFAVPGVYAALAAGEFASDAFASVRYGVSAAEALPAEIWRRFHDRYGVEILDGVGTTEATHIFISNRPDNIQPGSVGTIVPGFEARLLDENDVPVPDGEPGRLFIRGDALATGYWCQAALSRSTFQGEWAHTGDMYCRSSEGRYTYLGRSNDMFKASGEWVSPAEVEAVLTEHPAVLEAAVVPEPDEAGLVRPAAYVRLAAERSVGDEEFVEWCRSRLAGFKRPRRITVVAELPKTLTGKIQRYRLREASSSEG
jgi:benzoate-CoA ligase family protein